MSCPLRHASTNAVLLGWFRFDSKKRGFLFKLPPSITASASLTDRAGLKLQGSWWMLKVAPRNAALEINKIKKD